MYKMGLYDPFENLKQKLWPKEGLEVKLPIWFMIIKLGIALIYLRVGGMPYIVGKLLMKNTTFL
jgi:hypothetical protein